MERWKLTHADRYQYRPNEPILKGGARTRSKEQQSAISAGDAVYECDHGVAVYKLRADEAGLYILPRPVCVECVGEMMLMVLFGETRGSW